jgi:hypothetical protein
LVAELVHQRHNIIVRFANGRQQKHELARELEALDLELVEVVAGEHLAGKRTGALRARASRIAACGVPTSTSAGGSSRPRFSSTASTVQREFEPGSRITIGVPVNCLRVMRRASRPRVLGWHRAHDLVVAQHELAHAGVGCVVRPAGGHAEIRAPVRY